MQSSADSVYVVDDVRILLMLEYQQIHSAALLYIVKGRGHQLNLCAIYWLFAVTLD